MERSVIVLSKLPKLLGHLKSKVPNVAFHRVTPGSQEAVSELEKTEILIADADLLASHLDHLKSLKWAQLTWAGVDKLAAHLAGRKIPYQISRYSDERFGFAMSEYTVSHIFNFERDQRQQYENEKNKIWYKGGKIEEHRLICDLTIGILGIGSIGKHVAQILSSLGATVWGLSRTLPKEKISCLERHVTTKELPEILRVSDYIVSVLPSTQETNGLLYGDVLEHCKEKRPVFMNIGRGNTIRETDIIRAIENRWISAAILDVFQEEPLPPSSRLWSIPEVTISPHISGVTNSIGIAEAFAKNHVKYLNGEEIPNKFDANRGY
ncbi:glyoxylate/hydroxypyruvate reductase A-like [Athalia rosae]|uniref:glyoxylate/hydroxypyruvate reductase A-like n=1 Tax=Athalia rosae TaxID=37344 RepID=UPI0020331FDD|nr:glyoxylate/hydroxypyruvate reductase A-like [Athalia rosae]